MTDPEMPISPAGMQRREAILRLAKQQAGKKRFRRRGRHAAIAIIPLLFVAGILMQYVRSNSSNKSQPVAKTSPIVVPAPRLPVPPVPAVIISWITTDPTITDRLAIRPQRRTWKEMNDDQLLQSLAAAGQPSGLIRLDGRIYLLRR